MNLWQIILLLIFIFLGVQLDMWLIENNLMEYVR